MDTLKKLLTVLWFFTVTLTTGHYLMGCEGSESGKSIDTTVKELSGKNAVDKGEKMKQQINKLEADEIEKVQQDIKNGTYGEQEEKDKE